MQRLRNYSKQLGEKVKAKKWETLAGLVSVAGEIMESTDRCGRFAWMHVLYQLLKMLNIMKLQPMAHFAHL